MAERNCTRTRRARNAPLPIKQCNVCGADFTPAQERSKVCSKRCYYKARDASRPKRTATHTQRGPFKCANCGIEYMTRRPRGEGEKYCGRECAFSHISAVAEARRKVSASAKIAATRATRAVREAKRTMAKEAAAAHTAMMAEQVSVVCACCFKPFIVRRKVARMRRRCGECVRARDIKARAKYQSAYRKTPTARANKKRWNAVRRARVAIDSEAIDPIAVFRRDCWRCHLCGKRTPLKLRGTYDDMAPELDHIITLADGGSHTWGNVACACRRCNIAKGARSLGQLNLGLAA